MRAWGSRTEPVDAHDALPLAFGAGAIPFLPKKSRSAAATGSAAVPSGRYSGRGGGEGGGYSRGGRQVGRTGGRAGVWDGNGQKLRARKRRGVGSRAMTENGSSLLQRGSAVFSMCVRVRMSFAITLPKP